MTFLYVPGFVNSVSYDQHLAFDGDGTWRPDSISVSGIELEPSEGITVSFRTRGEFSGALQWARGGKEVPFAIDGFAILRGPTGVIESQIGQSGGGGTEFNYRTYYEFHVTPEDTDGQRHWVCRVSAYLRATDTMPRRDMVNGATLEGVFPEAEGNFAFSWSRGWGAWIDDWIVRTTGDDDAFRANQRIVAFDSGNTNSEYSPFRWGAWELDDMYGGLWSPNYPGASYQIRYMAPLLEFNGTEVVDGIGFSVPASSDVGDGVTLGFFGNTLSTIGSEGFDGDGWTKMFESNPFKSPTEGPWELDDLSSPDRPDGLVWELTAESTARMGLPAMVAVVHDGIVPTVHEMELVTARQASSLSPLRIDSVSLDVALADPPPDVFAFTSNLTGDFVFKRHGANASLNAGVSISASPTILSFGNESDFFTSVTAEPFVHLTLDLALEFTSVVDAEAVDDAPKMGVMWITNPLNRWED